MVTHAQGQSNFLDSWSVIVPVCTSHMACCAKYLHRTALAKARITFNDEQYSMWPSKFSGDLKLPSRALLECRLASHLTDLSISF